MYWFINPYSRKRKDGTELSYSKILEFTCLSWSLLPVIPLSHFHPFFLPALPPWMLASFSTTAGGVLKAGNIATCSLLRLYILMVLQEGRKGSPLSQHQIEKSHGRKEWNNKHCGQGVEICYWKKVYHQWGIYSLNSVFSSVWSAVSEAECGVPKSFLSIYFILMFKELNNWIF